MCKLINNLEVICVNKGCFWKGKFLDVKKYGNDCGKCVVFCFNGCVFRCEWENIFGYLLLCVKGKVDCLDCGKKVEREVML